MAGPASSTLFVLKSDGQRGDVIVGDGQWRGGHRETSGLGGNCSRSGITGNQIADHADIEVGRTRPAGITATVGNWRLVNVVVNATVSGLVRLPLRPGEKPARLSASGLRDGRGADAELQGCSHADGVRGNRALLLALLVSKTPRPRWL